ncbi:MULTISPECIES: VOC family protein [unclassified Mesorhizobium]|uniref:VOC family protein n=1 Tax=unclassified Mesorhizobium TaxID=325217 RepID=UPI00143F654B|nr:MULTISPECIES: VOC family protein [unclassified Mesorhizobium]
MAPVFGCRDGIAKRCPAQALHAKIVSRKDRSMTPCPPASLRFLGERAQLAYVVRDIDAAIKYWTEVMRIGPFVLIETSRGPRDFFYRGQVTEMDFYVAFAYMGDVQIELIQPKDDHPSLYKEFFAQGREGFHHSAFWPEDFPAACKWLEANGFVEIGFVRMKDGAVNVAYYETPAMIGSIIEVVPLTADRMAYFNRIHRLCRDWDGESRPLRRFVDRAAFLASGEGA